MAKRRADELAPDFDADGFERFRQRVLSWFVAVDEPFGPRVRDLGDPEDRVETALRARARWAKEDDFARALVDPAEVVDRPKGEK